MPGAKHLRLVVVSFKDLDSNKNNGIMGWNGGIKAHLQAHHGVNPAALHGHRTVLQECTAGKKDASVV